MHIRSISVDGNFKAFSGLTIQDVPPSRFVLLVGPNGSGKSSVFDAILYWSRRYGRPQTTGVQQDYYAHPDGTIAQNINLEFHDPEDLGQAGRRIHVRSAYRFTPVIRTSGISNQASLKDQPVVTTMNDQDATAMRHYQTLVGRFVRLLSDFTQERTLADARAELNPLVQAVKKMFPHLELESLGDALQDGSFFFSKNDVRNFRYENLSSGEKAAFDLLLDLYMARTEFGDGVICLDEPETHLSPRVQAALLDAIEDLLPATCQIWIATHSVGVLRRAIEIKQAQPFQVSFLSFEDRAQGGPLVLQPAVADRTFWRSALSVALDDIATLVGPDTVYLCEGSADPTKDSTTYAWDARIYRGIFQLRYPQVEFVSVGGKAELQSAEEIATVVAPGSARLRLRDRDSMTMAGRKQALDADPSLRILGRRSLENYLVDNEVIDKLVFNYGLKDGKSIEDLRGPRDTAINSADRSDSAKSAVGVLYDAAKATLKDNGQLGENRYQFSRDVLAPLIVPGMTVYDELRQALGLPSQG